MDQLNPHARRDEYGSRINRSHSPVLVYSIPYLTVIIGIIVPNLILTSAVPIVPPLGFMMLLAWRIVRPGLFPIWIGFPLGAIDDMFSGQPFGSSILLWSLAMIAIEVVEARFPWRTYMQDWMNLSLVITVYIFAAALISGAEIGYAIILAIVPQLLLSVLLFPIIARMVSRLDRLRLMRVKVIG